MRRPAVGMVNRRPRTAGGKNAQKQGEQKRPGPLHNWGLSILAIRRSRCYQVEFSWQAIFLCWDDLFLGRSEWHRKVGSAVTEAVSNLWQTPSTKR
jgi:hypothetical protein